MMKKVLFAATVVKTHIMEFHIPYLKMFKEAGWETAVASRNDYANPADCMIPYCDIFYDVPFVRNPFHPKNLAALRQLKKIIDSGGYDIIHCHTPVGAMLTRIAARKARKRGTTVIYTVHGLHFYTGAPPVNWLLYYPEERLLAHWTDILITINKEDYERAKHFKAGRVEYVPGVGIDLNRFCAGEGVDREKKREELGLAPDEFVLLSVGELIARKNHRVVLEALKLLREQGRLEGIRYVICGSGKLEGELKALASAYRLDGTVSFLGYRTDVNEIYRCCDLFVFMSFQEGLPVALMEAMATGLPVVCTDIRGNNDLIENGKSGEIIGNSAGELADAIMKMKDRPNVRVGYARKAEETIQEFGLEKVEEKMRKIYFGEPKGTVPNGLSH